MAQATTTKLKDELLRLEREYLEAVETKDAKAAVRLTAPESIVVSGRGAMKVDGEMIGRMIAEHDAGQRYTLDERSAEVVEVSDDVAIVTYRLTTIKNGGSSDAFDTDVWVRQGKQWKCALHAEVPAT